MKKQKFSLRTLVDTRHPAVNNMCKRLVFHYVSLFSIIIITLSPFMQPHTGVEDKSSWFIECVRNRCVQKLFFLLPFCFVVVFLINKGDGITFGHSFIKSLLLRIKGQQQPIILVSFDTLHMFEATGSLEYTSEYNNTKVIFASISMYARWQYMLISNYIDNIDLYSWHEDYATVWRIIRLSWLCFRL